MSVHDITDSQSKIQSHTKKFNIRDNSTYKVKYLKLYK